MYITNGIKWIIANRLGVAQHVGAGNLFPNAKGWTFYIVREIYFESRKNTEHRVCHAAAVDSIPPFESKEQSRGNSVLAMVLYFNFQILQ